MKITGLVYLGIIMFLSGCVAHQPEGSELWTIRLEDGAVGTTEVLIKLQPISLEEGQEVNFKIIADLTEVEGYGEAEVMLSVSGVVKEGQLTANVNGSGDFEVAGFSARFNGNMTGELSENSGQGELSLLGRAYRGKEFTGHTSFQNHSTWYLEKGAKGSL